MRESMLRQSDLQYGFHAAKTHLCHPTINFAVMHKSGLAQRRGNLRPSG
jgi:hypothetical protein